MNQAIMITFPVLPHFATFQPTIWRYTSELRVHPYASFGVRGRDRQTRMNEVVVTSSSSNFPSTAWRNHFLSYTSELTEVTTQEKLQLEELKETVRKMFVETPDSSTEKLVLIDTVQRLGVAYHFDNEIETSIRNIFDVSQQSENNDDNLYSVALRFRLVRQQGYYMSSDVFKQFTNYDGKFTRTLVNDVQAVLSLYEATHFRVHGEEILEEALIFTTTHLESMVMVSSLSCSIKAQITKALSLPIRRTVPRVGARKYIHIYENMESHNDSLLEFSKLDFNILQKQHQRELSELTSWWKDLDFANKLPYGRDKLVEAYSWMMAICFEPQYSRARRMLTKVLAVNTIIDDTYDTNYATLAELVHFADAIQRWDIAAMDSLPPYLRSIYQVLLDIYNEMEEVLTREGKFHSIYYAKNEMKRLVRAYLKEAEWLNAGYIPKCGEYMENALVTSTCMLYITISVVCTEERITKETLEWMTSKPLIVQASSTICRLMDDIGDHEVDQQKGHVASFVECYIREYGVSKEDAYLETRKEVMNAWKDINKEFLCTMQLPMFVLKRTLNFAQMVDTFDKDEHGHRNSKAKVKDLITLLFVESIKI